MTFHAIVKPLCCNLWYAHETGNIDRPLDDLASHLCAIVAAMPMTMRCLGN